MIGKGMYDIDTPALVIDLDGMERNIRRMADFFRDRPAKLRPHAKTHKTPELARMQLDAGAIGITCAKLGEAEVMANAGIRDLLVANEVIGTPKIARLVEVARRSDIMVAVDSAENARAISEAAEEAGVRVRVLIEVDVGQNRCGVKPGEPAVRLAQEVLKRRGLLFRGIMGYEGHIVLNPDREARESECQKSMTQLVGTKEALEAAGIPVEIVSGGGTGTYAVTGAFPGVTEVQAGSYITMDARYKGLNLGFECALTVLTTVVSRNGPEVVVCDAGMKAVTREFGMPESKDPRMEVTHLSEEHGKLAVKDPGGVPHRVGDKIEIIPSHGCTTINLHDTFYGVRAGKVEAVWDIAARGKVR